MDDEQHNPASLPPAAAAQTIVALSRTTNHVHLVAGTHHTAYIDNETGAVYSFGGGEAAPSSEAEDGRWQQQEAGFAHGKTPTNSGSNRCCTI